MLYICMEKQIEEHKTTRKEWLEAIWKVSLILIIGTVILNAAIYAVNTALSEGHYIIVIVSFGIPLFLLIILMRHYPVKKEEKGINYASREK